MEAQARRKFSLLFVGQDFKTFFKLDDESQLTSFQVTLYKKMPIHQIQERMEKAFGDI